MPHQHVFEVEPALAALGVRHGDGGFRGTWAQRHPFNIPGPIYVGDDDACGCGPITAPLNVFQVPDRLCSNTGEFVFRQPTTHKELSAVLSAAGQNPVRAYGLDGNAHWSWKSVSEWWRGMRAILPSLRSSDEEQARWVAYLQHGAEHTLREYVAFLETGGWPKRRTSLPEL